MEIAKSPKIPPHSTQPTAMAGNLRVFDRGDVGPHFNVIV